MKQRIEHSGHQLSLDFGESTVEQGLPNVLDVGVLQRPSVRLFVIEGGLTSSAKMADNLDPTSQEITQIIRSTAQAIGW
jgi:hypothetical protein